MWEAHLKLKLIGKWWKICLICNLAKVLRLETQFYAGGTGRGELEDEVSCRNIYCTSGDHPGVSCYWAAQGKTPSDKKLGGRTFECSDKSLLCDECCNGDRCDDRTHRDRDNCPYCLGSGKPAQLLAGGNADD